MASVCNFFLTRFGGIVDLDYPHPPIDFITGAPCGDGETFRMTCELKKRRGSILAAGLDRAHWGWDNGFCPPGFFPFFRSCELKDIAKRVKYMVEQDPSLNREEAYFKMLYQVDWQLDTPFPSSQNVQAIKVLGEQVLNARFEAPFLIYPFGASAPATTSLYPSFESGVIFLKNITDAVVPAGLYRLVYTGTVFVNMEHGVYARDLSAKYACFPISKCNFLLNPFDGRGRLAMPVWIDELVPEASFSIALFRYDWHKQPLPSYSSIAGPPPRHV
jgi:hypothetical protein